MRSSKSRASSSDSPGASVTRIGPSPRTVRWPTSSSPKSTRCVPPGARWIARRRAQVLVAERGKVLVGRALERAAAARQAEQGRRRERMDEARRARVPRSLRAPAREHLPRRRRDRRSRRHDAHEAPAVAGRETEERFAGHLDVGLEEQRHAHGQGEADHRRQVVVRRLDGDLVHARGEAVAQIDEGRLAADEQALRDVHQQAVHRDEAVRRLRGGGVEAERMTLPEPGGGDPRARGVRRGFEREARAREHGPAAAVRDGPARVPVVGEARVDVCVAHALRWDRRRSGRRPARGARRARRLRRARAIRGRRARSGSTAIDPPVVRAARAMHDAALGRAVAPVDDGVGLDRAGARSPPRRPSGCGCASTQAWSRARVDALPAARRRRAAEDAERVLRAAPAEARARARARRGRRAAARTSAAMRVRARSCCPDRRTTGARR